LNFWALYLNAIPPSYSSLDGSPPAVIDHSGGLHWQPPEWFKNICFVLLFPSHPGNVGSAARAMRVMGFKHLRVVGPRHANVGKQPKAIALASGALDVLENLQEFETIDEALHDIELKVAVSATGREFGPVPRTPEEMCAEIVQLSTAVAVLDDAPKIALIFGTERTGMSIEQVQRCQRLCSIPGTANYQSLNLAQAVQILSYCLGRAAQMQLPVMQPDRRATDAEQSNDPGEKLANDAQVNGMLEHLEKMLIQTGFLDVEQPKKLMPRLQRLFNRAMLKRSEVDILRGIYASIEKHQQSRR
jgi:tRNA/rRNA methyltransferase